MANRLLVLDSWPVMEWLKGRQPTTERFRALLDDASAGKAQLLISTHNLGEVYYLSWREWGEIRANQIRVDFAKLPILIVHPSASDVLAAARIKAQYNFPYADSFAVVLAVEFGATILTGDPDFLGLPQDLVPVEWWGK